MLSARSRGLGLEKMVQSAAAARWREAVAADGDAPGLIAPGAVAALGHAVAAGVCGKTRQSIRLTARAKLSSIRITTIAARNGFIRRAAASRRSLSCRSEWSGRGEVRRTLAVPRLIQNSARPQLPRRCGDATQSIAIGPHTLCSQSDIGKRRCRSRAFPTVRACRQSGDADMPGMQTWCSAGQAGGGLSDRNRTAARGPRVGSAWACPKRRRGRRRRPSSRRSAPRKDGRSGRGSKSRGRRADG